jgi:rod shape-determining protein MreD
MSFSAARPLDPWRWIGVPALLCAGFTILFASPIRIFGLHLPEPVFPLVCAFGWAVIRPSIIAPFTLLLLGCFLDIFWGGALGLWGVSLLVAYAGTLFMRNMMTGQSRPMMWAWYAGVCAAALATGYLITMLDVKSAPNLIALFWQFLATSLLYPFAHRLIDRFDDADVRFR